jgi:predicted DNA-binding transcriptional regulator AlpA
VTVRSTIVVNLTTPTVTLRTAGKALGIGESSAYAAVKSGTFPVPVIRIGGRYTVPTAPLRELLGLPPLTERSPEVA